MSLDESSLYFLNSAQQSQHGGLTVVSPTKHTLPCCYDYQSQYVLQPPSSKAKPGCCPPPTPICVGYPPRTLRDDCFFPGRTPYDGCRNKGCPCAPLPQQPFDVAAGNFQDGYSLSVAPLPLPLGPPLPVPTPAPGPLPVPPFYPPIQPVVPIPPSPFYPPIQPVTPIVPPSPVPYPPNPLPQPVNPCCPQPLQPPCNWCQRDWQNPWSVGNPQLNVRW